MVWHKTIELIRPHVVRIETPTGSGTGFFFGRNATGAITAIATAAHVVADADEWRQPMKISTASEVLYTEYTGRAIDIDHQRDSAVIAIPGNALRLPEKPLNMCDRDSHLRVGAAIGWLGYPGIAPGELCFFRGYVSAWVEERDHYFVDGVAIHGVSGGPVFTDYAEPDLVGLVSAYRPNRQHGDTLPGLLMCQDVTWMHKVVDQFRTFDEARRADEARKSDPTQQSEDKPVGSSQSERGDST